MEAWACPSRTDGKVDTTRVLGLDSWCERSLTPVEALVDGVKRGKKIWIMGHTRDCVEEVDTTGHNRWLGDFIVHRNASGTILAYREITRRFAVTWFDGGRRVRITHRYQRDLVLDFHMNVPGFVGLMCTDVDDRTWERLTNHSHPHGRNDDDKSHSDENNTTRAAPSRSMPEALRRTRIADDITPEIFALAHEYMAMHLTLGHPGEKTMRRTLTHKCLTGCPPVSNAAFKLMWELFGGQCSACASVNATKQAKRTEPRRDASVTVRKRATDTPLDRLKSEVPEQLLVTKARTIGLDIAYFSEKPYLILVDGNIKVTLVKKLADGSRTAKSITAALTPMLTEYKRDHEDVLSFVALHMEDDTKYGDYRPQTAEMDGEPGLAASVRELNSLLKMEVQQHAAGSHVSYCERQIREIRRRRGAMVACVAHALTPVEDEFSWVAAATTMSLTCHTNQTVIPYTAMTRRTVHYNHVTVAAFGDVVMATKQGGGVGNGGFAQELGVVVGHYPRILRGIQWYNPVTGKVRPRNHFFGVDGIDMVAQYGANRLAVPRAFYAKTLDQFLMKRSKTLNDEHRDSPYVLRTFSGTDPEFSPAKTSVPHRITDQVDELDEDAEFEVDNLRHQQSTVIVPKDPTIDNDELADRLTSLTTHHNSIVNSIPDRPDSPWRGVSPEPTLEGVPPDKESRGDMTESPSDGATAETTATGHVVFQDTSRGVMDAMEVDAMEVPLDTQDSEDEITPFLSSKERCSTPVPFVDIRTSGREQRRAAVESYVNTTLKDVTGRRTTGRTETKCSASKRTGSGKQQDKDLSFREGAARFTEAAAFASQDAEIKQLVTDYAVFEPSKLNYCDVENLYGSRGFMTKKSDGTIKSRVVVTLKTGKNARTPTDFGMSSYAPTLDIKLLLTMLSICAQHDLKLTVWDVKGAYFKTAMSNNGVYVKLNKEIAAAVVREKPEWEIFLKEDGTMLVEALKAWYGTEPAAALWHRDIKECIVVDCGYTQHSIVHCLFFRRDETGRISFMLLHVDDIGAMMPRDGAEKRRVRGLLEAKYDKLKQQDGDAVVYVGLGIKWDKQQQRYEVDMQKYIEKVCREYDIFKGVTNPNRSDNHLIRDGDEDPVESTEYRGIIGVLRYICSLLLFSGLYQTGVLSTRQVTPVVSDYNDAVRVLKWCYKVRERKHIINAYGDDRTLYVWCDASFGTFPDGKSQQCVVMKIGDCDGAVFAGSWKQTAIASSVSNAEVMCLSTGVQYGRYFRDVLRELGPEFDMRVVYFEDNKSCYDMVIGDAVSNVMKEKFINVRINVIKEYGQTPSNRATIIKVKTGDQWSDIGTKGMFGTKFEEQDNFIVGHYEGPWFHDGIPANLQAALAK